MAKKNFDDMMADQDYPPEVHDAVLNEIAKNGNEARIISGEMHLPSRQDAIHWHDRQTGRYGLSDREKQLEDRIRALESQQGIQHEQE